MNTETKMRQYENRIKHAISRLEAGLKDAESTKNNEKRLRALADLMIDQSDVLLSEGRRAMNDSMLVCLTEGEER